MGILRLVLTVMGVLLFVSGAFWALQGAGIIMWPSSSFMLADKHWVLYGILTANFGLLQLYLVRRS